MQNVQIRFAVPDDAPDILEIYAPYVLKTAITLTSQVPTVQQIAQTMQDVQRHYPYLVCCIADKVVGFAFAGRSRPHEAYNWNAETSIYISPDHQGRGIATALYTALLQLLRLQGYCNVYAIITLPNDASVALHKHFGFNELTLMRQGGFKLGQWRDVLWMEYRIPNCCDPNSHGRPIRPDELNQNDVDTSLAMATALLSGAQ